MAQGRRAHGVEARQKEGLSGVGARIASVAAALLSLAGLACLGLALHAHLGNRDVRSQAVQSGTGPLTPFEVTLAPAMNPMRITVTAKVDERNRAALRGAREYYQMSLYRDGRPLRRWMEALSAEDENRRPRAQASFSVAPVEIAEAGTYLILLLRRDGDSAPGFAGHVVRIERSGARAADVTLAWQGGVLLVLGILFQLFLGLPLKFVARMRGMRD